MSRGNSIARNRMNVSRVPDRRKSTFDSASLAPASRAAASNVFRLASWSVSPGRIGMMKSRVATAASANARMAPNRRSGRGARGSSRRASAGSALDGQVHGDLRRTGDRAEERGVASDEGRLRRDRQAQARHLSRRLEDAACDAEACLCRLIRISRCAEGHRLTALRRLRELSDQAAAVDVLHVDRSLEGIGIVEPEKLMRVPRKAVMATHLAAAIRVDRPAERHRARVELAYEAL